MKNIQYKSFSGIEIKSNIEKGIIEGYASVFGNKDSHGDIIVPKAFNKTVSDWKTCKPSKRRIKVCYQHDWKEPIGIPLELEPDNHGLYTVGKISRTPDGEKVLILANDGVLNEMSIGFLVVNEKYSNEKQANMLNELKLMEYSIVTWGSNELTTVDNVKHMMKEYAYSKGNILDIFVETLLEKVKALSINNEPSEDTQIIVPKSQNDDKEDSVINELLLEIKKMKKE